MLAVSNINLASWTEADRLGALRNYRILYTPAEPHYDEMISLVAEICDVPSAVISFVDEGVQWYKARYGIDVEKTSRAISLCNIAMEASQLVIIADTAVDPRVATNPLVVGEPGIRFFAGVPLANSSGIPLGALCIFDTKPRPQGLSSMQMRALQVFARQVVQQVEQRYAQSMHEEIVTTLAEREAQFRALANSTPQLVWSSDAAGHMDYFNARWHAFTGVPHGPVSPEILQSTVHPDDVDRICKAWDDARATVTPLEAEWRIRRHDGVYHWALCRAEPVFNERGEVSRWFGTCTNIEDQKRIEKEQSLLTHELLHRIKNIFSVVSALVTLSAREQPHVQDFAQSVRERIGALANAHRFVRPHPKAPAPALNEATLHHFLNELFRPYCNEDGQQRVLISGEDAQFDEQSAAAVALLFHELATNSAKYGALSSRSGTVELTTDRKADRFVLNWREHDGPEITADPEHKGFGSSLIKMAVEGQLGGKLTRKWHREGLEVTADLPNSALSRHVRLV